MKARSNPLGPTSAEGVILSYIGRLRLLRGPLVDATGLRRRQRHSSCRKNLAGTARIARKVDYADISCGRYRRSSSPVDMILSSAKTSTDCGLMRRNRQFSGSFLHFNVCAVDAGGTFRAFLNALCDLGVFLCRLVRREYLSPRPWHFGMACA